jgi:hypothetical protein
MKSKVKDGIELFWNHVDKRDDHWLWMAATNSAGYGVVNNTTFHNQGAHKVSWEIEHQRPFPPGYYLRNLCGKTNCVKPDHWELTEHQRKEKKRERYKATSLSRFIAKFWALTSKVESGCWEWQAYRGKLGYGRVVNKHFPGGYAHRIAWRITNGDIPNGLCVCHKCSNPSCCNPDHLYLGTLADSIHLSMAKGRRPTSQGPRYIAHPMSKEDRVVALKRGFDAWWNGLTHEKQIAHIGKMNEGKRAKHLGTNAFDGIGKEDGNNE